MLSMSNCALYIRLGLHGDADYRSCIPPIFRNMKLSTLITQLKKSTYTTLREIYAYWQWQAVGVGHRDFIVIPVTDKRLS